MGGDAARPLLDSEVGPSDCAPANGAAPSTVVDIPNGAGEQVDQPDEHEHFSNRAPWLRAMVLGANDGLVSVGSLMLGVGGGSTDQRVLVLSGLSALVGGALSMACGEYISVASQKDAEQADIQKEIEQQQKGPLTRLHELEELQQIYMDRGLDADLARQVAVQLTRKDVIRTHARDELGIDVDELANPWQAAFTSLLAFTLGAGIPFLAGIFIPDHNKRMLSVSAAATLGLATFGAVGAWLGGAKRVRASLRVLVGGWSAFGVTYGVGLLFGESGGG